MSRFRASATAAITAACLLAGTGLAQAAQPGDVCQVNPRDGGWSINPGGSPPIYYVYFPSYVRIVAFDGPNAYTARANGQANGQLLRIAVNQGTCHQ